MGIVSSVKNRKDSSQINNKNYSITKTMDQQCDKTIEDEEPLKQIQLLSIQINKEEQTQRFIQKQNDLFPQESTLSYKWKKNVRIQSSTDALTEFKITSKGILKSPNSHPQSMKSNKRVSFDKEQLREEKFFRSHFKKKHKVTLQDLEKLF